MRWPRTPRPGSPSAGSAPCSGPQRPRGRRTPADSSSLAAFLVLWTPAASRWLSTRIKSAALDICKRTKRLAAWRRRSAHTSTRPSSSSDTLPTSSATANSAACPWCQQCSAWCTNTSGPAAGFGGVPGCGGGMEAMASTCVAMLGSAPPGRVSGIHTAPTNLPLAVMGDGGAPPWPAAAAAADLTAPPACVPPRKVRTISPVSIWRMATSPMDEHTANRRAPGDHARIVVAFMARVTRHAWVRLR
jgi:hypothetical protein